MARAGVSRPGPYHGIHLSPQANRADWADQAVACITQDANGNGLAYGDFAQGHTPEWGEEEDKDFKPDSKRIKLDLKFEPKPEVRDVI